MNTERLPDAPSPTSPVARNAVLTAVGLALIGVVRITSGITAEALFGMNGLAIVTAAISVATLSTIIGSAGMSAGITKLIAQLRGQGDPEGAASLSRLVARVAVAFTIVGAVAGTVYSLLDERIAAGGVAIVISAAALTLSYGTYQAGKAIAYGEEKVTRYLTGEALGAVGFGIALAIVAVFDISEAVVVPLVIAYLPVGWIALSRLRGPIPNRSSLPTRSLAGYGVIGSVGSLAGIGFTRLTPLVAGFLAGTPGTALVGATLFVLEPLYLAPRAISLALLPNLSFATAVGSQSRAAETVRASTGLIALLAAPFCTVLILERDRILQVIFSDEVVGGATLAWFSAAFLVSVIGVPAVTALAAIRVRVATIPMWSSVAGFSVAIAVWLIAGPRHGTAAVAFGYLLGSMVQVGYPLVVATRLYQITWGWFWLRLMLLAIGIGATIWSHPSLLLDAALVGMIFVVLFPEVRGFVKGLLLRLVK